MISAILIAVLLHSSAAEQTASSRIQTHAQMQQVLRKAQESGKAVKVILVPKINSQQELNGKVSDVSDTGFVLTDQETGGTRTLTYGDVRLVKQKGMSKGAKILLTSGVIVGVVVALGFALACSSEGGPHC